MVCRLQSRADLVHVACLLRAGRAGTVGRHGLIGGGRRRRVGRSDEPTPAAAAHLSAFAASRARLVRGPFMGRPLLMSRAAALARDLALLLGGHRRKSSPLFTFSSSHGSASVLLVVDVPPHDVGTLAVRLRGWILHRQRTRLVSRRLGRLIVFLVARILAVPGHGTPAIIKVYATTVIGAIR